MDPLKNKIVFSLDVYIFLPTSNRIVIILQFIYTTYYFSAGFRTAAAKQATSSSSQPAAVQQFWQRETFSLFACWQQMMSTTCKNPEKITHPRNTRKRNPEPG